jgi:thiol-disulfide isomerase/thioredoxin
LQCEVVADAGLKFQKPVLLEQYTGTWCGWCPRAIANIESIQTTDNNIVHIALHLSDGMSYFQNITLFQSFGFQGIPTVHADRQTVWQGESYILTNLHTPSRAGLALEVSGNATEINAKVKAKFGNSFVDGLKISVYMVHDSLVSTQTNYYNTDPTSKFYQKGDVISGFFHRNVMIMTGLDMFGETVPKDSVEIGSTFSKSVTFRSFRCDNIKNIKIIAFLTNSTGLKKGQVVNCIIARVGEKKGFAVVTR